MLEIRTLDRAWLTLKWLTLKWLTTLGYLFSVGFFLSHKCLQWRFDSQIIEGLCLLTGIYLFIYGCQKESKLSPGKIIAINIAWTPFRCVLFPLVIYWVCQCVLHDCPHGAIIVYVTESILFLSLLYMSLEVYHFGSIQIKDRSLLQQMGKYRTKTFKFSSINEESVLSVLDEED